MRYFTVTQAELDAQNKPLLEISKRLHANDQPLRRDEFTIQHEIDRAVENHESSKQLMVKFASKLTDAMNNLKRYKLAETYWSDPKQGNNPVEARQALRELRGHDYYSKGYDRTEHHDGLIEVAERDIAEFTRRHDVAAAAVENTRKDMERRLPVLKKELADARRLSAASRF